MAARSTRSAPSSDSSRAISSPRLRAQEERRARQDPATYDYTDEAGKLLFQVVRFTPKEFRQRRPDGNGGWIWKLGNTRRVLYRLPEVIARSARARRSTSSRARRTPTPARAPGSADDRADGRGQVEPQGVQRDAGRRAPIVIVADNDDEGCKHAEQVARHLRRYGNGGDIEITKAKTGKDLFDHLEAGHTIDELELIAHVDGAHADAPESPATEATDDQREGESATQPPGITDKRRSGPGPLILDPPGEPMPVARDFLKAHYAYPDSDPDDPLPLLRAWRSGWWTWEGPKWVEVEDRRVRGRAYKYTEHAQWWKKQPDGKAKLEPWAPTTRKISDLLDALKAVTFLHRDVDQPEWIEPVDMPGARELVSVANGLLHIHTRDVVRAQPTVLQPDRRAVRATTRTRPSRGVGSSSSTSCGPKTQTPIAALQEFFGYVLSGRTDQHKILLLVGPLRGGKGTIARILKSLVGDGNCAGPTLASLGTNFGMSPLIGKPLAIVSDARLGGPNTHQVVERLLSVSGEDMQTIDIKYNQPWTGTLPTRFVIISNELPSFGDSSGAIASRFIALQLTRSWLGDEDTELTAKLREELSGILSWALDGLDRLNNQGRFTEPESSVDVMTALADLVSPVSAFVRDRCAVGPYSIPVQDLFAAWRGWAEDNGHTAGSSQSFGRDLRAAQSHVRVHQVRAEGDHRERQYLGVTLKHRVPRGAQ